MSRIALRADDDGDEDRARHSRYRTRRLSPRVLRDCASRRLVTAWLESRLAAAVPGTRPAPWRQALQLLEGRRAERIALFFPLRGRPAAG